MTTRSWDWLTASAFFGIARQGYCVSGPRAPRPVRRSEGGTRLRRTPDCPAGSAALCSRPGSSMEVAMDEQRTTQVTDEEIETVWTGTGMVATVADPQDADGTDADDAQDADDTDGTDS